MSKDIQSRSGRGRRRAAIGITLVAGLGGLLGVGVMANAKPNKPKPPKDPAVSLCHATRSGTNPYRLITVSASGAFHGHFNQDGKKPAHKWGNDIIPQFTYGGTTYGPQGSSSSGPDPQNGCFALQVKKTGPAQVAPGEFVNYTIAVTNTGKVDVPVSNVVVTDPNTQTPVPPLTPIDIAPGATVNWTAVSNTAVGPAPESCGTTIAPNTATVAFRTGPPKGHSTGTMLRANGLYNTQPSSSSTWDQTTVVCLVDLTVAKSTSSTTVIPGGTVPYTITVTNPSAIAVPFSAISVTDDGAVITPPADVSPLAPGTSRDWTATKVAPDGISACNTKMSNTAQVALVNLPLGYSAITPGGASSAVVGVPTIAGGICDALLEPAAVPAGFVTAGAPNLVVRKSGPATARRGGGMTYRLRVSNTGGVSATNVVLTDTPPTTMVIGGTPSGATRTGRTITWHLGTVPAHSSRTVSVTMFMRITARGTPCNIARATASNASSARGKACTRIAAIRDPAVTG